MASLADAAPEYRADALINQNPELALRLERIDRWRDDTWHALDAAWNRVHEAKERVALDEAELAKVEESDRRGQLIHLRHTGDWVDGHERIERGRDEARLSAAAAAVEASKARLKRARDVHDKASKAWQEAARLQENCARYVRQLTAYKPLERRPALLQGETHAEAAARLRAEIAALREESARVESAPATADEQRAVIRARIARAADSAAGIVIAARRNEVLWPEVVGAGIPGFPVVDTFALLAAMFPDRLAEVAGAGIEDDVFAMTAEQVRTRLAELAAQMLDLERDEEIHVRSAEQDGAYLPRRGDADPRAVLAIDGPAPKAL